MNRILTRTAFVAAMTTSFTITNLAAEELPADVVHAWVTAGEKPQVDVLSSAFAAEGGKWQSVAIAGSTGPVKTTINRILAGDPPSAAQFSTSQDHFDLVDKGMLAAIDDVSEANHWRDVMPQPILDAMARDGHTYLVPVAVHTPNFLWYNKKVLTDAGATVPTTMGDDFFAAMDKVKASGKIPFALSGTTSQLRFLFDAFLIDAIGPEQWNALWQKKDEAIIRGDGVKTAFERFKRVRDYADAGYSGRTWNPTLDLLMSGQAAFDVLGDWAIGTFNAAGLKLDADYGCVLAGNAMIIHADYFAFPKQTDPKKTAGQKLLAKVLVEADTQQKFSIIKGSIPPRKDVDISRFNTCAKASYAAFNDPKRVVGNDRTFLTPPAVGDVMDLLIEFMDTSEMKASDAQARFADIVLND
ncbi:ABC transporter substrate-binding protein [Rhizobium sp. CF142]|uniref:ABC transporter substrate-binding protein n=1 Tax=Rhizobium sp. CF142 TaxID=1144314 RepID=UPI00026EF6A2|nr:ABC transporter substrate-binding protein [Rhizobium sp. CF142]EJJ27120.1 ABC-type sugar transport system, periplasmic component [Rhizobium sp. CF142]